MATKLVNLQISAREQRKQMEPSSIATDGPRYPYGLAISLDTETLEKLDVGRLTAGDTVLLVGKATVRSVSTSESEDGGKRRDVSLQITDLCLEGGADDDDDTDAAAVAAKLYEA
jgi:hypothetical protein